VKLLKKLIVNFLVFLGLLRLGPVAQTQFYHPEFSTHRVPEKPRPTKHHH